MIGGNARRSGRVCCAGVVNQAIVINVTALLFLPFARLYGFTYAQLGLLTAVGFLAQLCADLTLMLLIDRIPAKTLALIASARSCISFWWRGVWRYCRGDGGFCFCGRNAGSSFVQRRGRLAFGRRNFHMFVAHRVCVGAGRFVSFVAWIHCTVWTAELELSDPCSRARAGGCGCCALAYRNARAGMSPASSIIFPSLLSFCFACRIFLIWLGSCDESMDLCFC